MQREGLPVLLRALPWSIVAAVILVATAVAAQPLDTTAFVVERVRQTEQDIGAAIIAARPSPRSPGEEPPEGRPWFSADFCTTAPQSRAATIGQFMIDQIEPPEGAGPITAGRIAPYAQRGIELYARLAATPLLEPVQDHPRWLAPGSVLSTPPATWGRAAAQRLEWLSLLEDLRGLIRLSATSTSFTRNYYPAIQAVLECDLYQDVPRFLAALDASGETIADPREADAVARLRQIAQALAE
jgi:hypothetical protein